MSAVQLTVVQDAAGAELAAAVAAAVEAALARLPAPAGAGLSVVLAPDETLRDLNRAYRGQDRATDVLSFPAAAEDQEPGAPPYLGDVLIAVPTAAAAAARAGQGLAEELSLLAVHGLLHLLGHEDETDEGARAMLRLEIALGVRRPEDWPEGLAP